MKTLKIIQLLALLPILVTVSAAAQVGVSPPRQEVRLDQGQSSHAFQVHNFGDRSRRFEVSLGNWTTDEDNQVVELPPGEHSLDGLLIVNPARFTIEPGDVQTVRFALAPGTDLEDGEHRTMMWFEESLSDEDINERNVRSRIRLGAAIYGHIGAIHRAARIRDVACRDGALEVTLSNSGNAHVRLDGRYAIWSSDTAADERRVPSGAEIKLPEQWPAAMHWAARAPQTPVLPGDTRAIDLAAGDGKRLPAGDYVLSIDATLGDQRIDGHWPFVVPE